jgi:bifunctional non-homologous end joining protein LigD
MKKSSEAETEKAAGTTEVTIDGHGVVLTHLDKTFWPKEKYTKGDVIHYYRTIAEYILPYLKDRPLSLRRHPNGIAGQSFWQKDVSGGAEEPPWVTTIKLPAESVDKDITYIVCQNEATLVYVANLGCIELNPWSSRLKSLDTPDYVVIDLDPEGVLFAAVVEVAQVIHEVLDKAQILNFCKTSGKRGLHIYIPLGAQYTYDQARQFSKIIVTLTHEQLPEITSLERSPQKRQKKVYLDWLQNRPAQTLAAPYSLRPWPEATVATPVTWEEVTMRLDPAKFNIESIPKRLKRIGDIWRPVIEKSIDMEKALSRLSG